MLTWYYDKNIAIEFSYKPSVGVRYPLPSMSEEQIKSIKQYPFINRKELYVELSDCQNGVTYTFTIPKGYCWNGSDIPRIFWAIIGSRTDPQYLVASCLHDYMLENKSYIEYNKRFTSDIFYGCLVAAKVGKIKAKIMAEAVNIYQSFQDW